MTITRHTAAEKLSQYLHHKIVVSELVDWAERALMDGEFEEQSASVLSSVVSRLGLADVRAFGLTWEDCEDMLKQLGYSARIAIKAG
jgi:hypothetical protein